VDRGRAGPGGREPQPVEEAVNQVSFEVPGFPLRFSEFPEPRDLEAPTLGQHNAEILHDYLGYPPERIRELEAEGILHRGER